MGNIRKEHVEERVDKADQSPRKPNQDGGDGHLLVDKESTEMNAGFGEGKQLLAVSRLNLSAGLKLLESQGAWAVVFGSQELECFHHLGILTKAEEILGRLAQSDHCDSKNRHDKHYSTTGEEHISPAPVVGLGTSINIGTVPFSRNHETPGNETSDGLSKAPPCCQEGQEPLLIARKILEEDGCVQDEVAASTEAEKGDEECERWPVGHGTSDHAACRADEEGNVKSPFATNDIGAETPENGARQHTDVHGDGKRIGVSMLAKFAESRRGNNGLEKEDQGIDGIATRHRRLAHQIIVCHIIHETSGWEETRVVLNDEVTAQWQLTRIH